MQGPDQASPPPAGLASVDLPPEQLSLLQDEMTDRPDVVRVLHKVSGMPQAGHRAVVLIRAQVALGAVFDGDVAQSGRHHRNRGGRGRAPVVIDAVGGVVISSGQPKVVGFIG